MTSPPPVELAEPFAGSPVTWPEPGVETFTLALSTDGMSRAQNAAAPGGLPVTVTPVDGLASDVLSGKARFDLADASDQPSEVQVQLLDRAQAEAIGAALLLRVSRTDGGSGGAVRLGLDYSAFASAYGGDWAWRLRLSTVPDCILTTPQVEGCTVVTPLNAANDGTVSQVSAEVALAETAQAMTASTEVVESGSGGVLVALAASGGSTETGDFTKTDLNPSSSWSAGGNSGAFSYTYPIVTPPVPGGLAPQVALSYSSGSVDGQTAGGHTQPSVIGEGWSYSPGYIERAYRPCSNDTDNSPYHPELMYGDFCWYLPNASIMLNGKSSEIVLGGDGTWRLENGDGEKVELVTGADNGDSDDGEHWRVTTQDGTQYYFGLDDLRTGQETHSVQTVPVYANHTSDPSTCRATDRAAWASSRCPYQAMRWMLDYVVDRNNNEITYFYESTDNKTALVGNAGFVQYYKRDIQLSRIEYGINKVVDPNATAKARAQVVFTYGDRCLTSSCGTHDKNNWPDTPWDLYCMAAPCTNNMTPSFWTTKRLTKIETQIRTGATYSTVDEWALAHSFPSTGTALSPVLWLNKITHTGKVGGTAATPSLEFPAVTSNGGRSQNRADYDPNASMASHMKYRIVQIKTETGKQIDVTYSADDNSNLGDGADCVFGGTLTFPNPDVNAHRCFPAPYTNPSGSSGWAWWHKRVVTKVVETDLVGGSPSVTSSYSYSTSSSTINVLWAHDDGAKVWNSGGDDRSWADWRGYSNVTVKVGPTGGLQSQHDYIYLRGLHGDKTDSGTRTVSVAVWDGAGNATDFDHRAGHMLEERIWDQAGGTPVQLIKHDPWTLITGTRTLTAAWSDYPSTLNSWILRTKKEIRWEWVNNAWSQRSLTDATLDTTIGAGAGRPLSLSDEGGPSTTDETCTRYTYADNTTAHKYAFASEIKTTTNGCTETDGPVLSDSRNHYDDQAWGTLAGRGNVTRTEALSDTGWITTSQNVIYDQNGQVASAKDSLGRLTSTAYIPNTDGLTETVTTTNPAGHIVSTHLDVSRGQPLSIIDANNKTTTGTYDPLGRLTSVTRPGNGSGFPDVAYTYSITGCPTPPTTCAPSWVQTKALGPNNNQISSYEIYDGFARVRQNQSTAPDGKRAVIDTAYDERSLAFKTSAFYNNASGPTSTLLTFNDVDVDRQTRYTFDGRGRKLTDELWSLNVLKWKTTTAYAWDRVSVTPPAGGTVTQDLFDDRGNAVEKRQYQGSTPTGAYDSTSYTYNLRKELTEVTDPAGNDWTYIYDLLGRQTDATDPDAGASHKTYDNAGRLITITDGRGQTLAYVYDSLGRKTELRSGSITGPLRARWTYDTVDNGQLTSSVRYDGGLAYTTTINSYDDGYRPESTTVTIPASTANSALADDYTANTTYTYSGAPASVKPPIKGGLPDETITTTYTNQGQINTLKSGIADYVSSMAYRWDGAVKQTINGTAGKQVRRTNSWDAPTGRLLVSQIDTENQTTLGTWVDRYTTSYGYDDAGNVTVIAGKTAGVRDQVECFSYDYLRRMTKAWTEATWVCSTPQRAGADPYWREWSFDVVGNRLTQSDKVPSGTDTNWIYSYPAPGTSQPHTLDAVNASGPLAGTATRAFDYDSAGNTTSRQTETGAAQTLTWDPEGNLATLTEGSNTTTYLYDADGNRLIARGPTKTTLYLGDTEIELPISGGSPLGTRYYGDTAIRNAAGLRWTGADHHGTQQIQIDATTMSATRNRTMPYGETRGAQGLFTGSKGFVGGVNDNSGLTHLGAREYDASTGRFVSVDPIMDMTDPAQWNGYAYSHSNPASASDPSGLTDCDFAAGCDVGGRETGTGKPGGGATGGGRDPHDGPSPTADCFAKGQCEQVPPEIPTYAAWLGMVTEQWNGDLDAINWEYQWLNYYCTYSSVEDCNAMVAAWGPYGSKTLTFFKEMFGIGDIERCFGGEGAGACVMAAIGFIPFSKLNAIARSAELLEGVGRLAVDMKMIADSLKAMGFANMNEFGRFVWGGRSLGNAMDFATPEKVAALRARGMTREWAENWRNFYTNVHRDSVEKWRDVNPENINKSAGSRVQLFQYILDNL
ncbi:RHS repeat-associated core domain-containing protein [Catellatospora sp. TT07R-123]|uniref:RHS repeat-associated core domain-containing protein n=1 Tax=Catellatospora sp. TT07R-123 TaxID=2733863 RepID=UPI001BB3A70E|nr:RHS repeat-associated core domain-containing protein [Catellatospora sp. TT07R-123]